MFLEEADLDDVRPSRGGESKEEPSGFGSAGGLTGSGGGRARMLAQQREIQVGRPDCSPTALTVSKLKKRQAALQAGGMVRASNDGRPSSSAGSAQFTPALRQFSAPKSVADTE